MPRFFLLVALAVAVFALGFRYLPNAGLSDCERAILSGDSVAIVTNCNGD